MTDIKIPNVGKHLPTKSLLKKIGANTGKSVKKSIKKNKAKISTKRILGSFGQVNFYIKTKNKTQINSFNKLSRESTYAWESADAYQNKKVYEFTGLSESTITLDIRLDASLGTSPKKECKKWYAMAKKGKIDYLIIGGRQIGKHKWKIDSISESWEQVTAEARPSVVNITVSFSMYK